MILRWYMPELCAALLLHYLHEDTLLHYYLCLHAIIMYILLYYIHEHDIFLYAILLLLLLLELCHTLPYAIFMPCHAAFCLFSPWYYYLWHMAMPYAFLSFFAIAFLLLRFHIIIITYTYAIIIHIIIILLLCHAILLHAAAIHIEDIHRDIIIIILSYIHAIHTKDTYIYIHTYKRYYYII